MDRIKLAKYSECCRESNVQFVPFVLLTFGKLGGEGDRFYQNLVAFFRHADPDFDSDRDLGSLYMQQLQVVLKRDVARMLLQGEAGYSSSDVTAEQPMPADLVDDYDRLIAAEPSVCAELPLHPQSDRLSVAAHTSSGTRIHITCYGSQCRCPLSPGAFSPPAGLPQANNKKRRLQFSPQAQRSNSQHADARQRVAAPNIPSIFYCPFDACCKASRSFAGWLWAPRGCARTICGTALLPYPLKQLHSFYRLSLPFATAV